MKYQDYVLKKTEIAQRSGVDGDVSGYDLMPHQRDLVLWALRRGRAAIFADTGLGKSRMQVAWADQVSQHGDVLILAPLAVAPQTVREGEAIGVDVNHCRDDSDARPGVNIINYDRLHLVDPGRFSGVVLDESSIIKHHTSKTLGALMDAFSRAPYRLCATATPAPNDYVELGTHAQFLGIRSQAEMLAEFFVHDGGETQKWRLKGHARRVFWQWVASWGAMVRSPADLGHDASMYDLPPLTTHEHIVRGMVAEGQLFAGGTMTLSERRKARKDSIEDRVAACAAIVNASDRPWVVWCELNAEGDALQSAIPGSTQVAGADDADTKESRLMDFQSGKARVLISKTSICGFGLNWQHCANVAFVGVSDSWESYYQAVRRCWRFGQKRPVDVHLFVSEAEATVLDNLKRKEQEARAMGEWLAEETASAVMESVIGQKREYNDYSPAKAMELPAFMGAA